MMFLDSTASRNSGTGGKSRVRIKNGVVLVEMLEESSNLKRSPEASDLAVISCDSTLSFP